MEIIGLIYCVVALYWMRKYLMLNEGGSIVKKAIVVLAITIWPVSMPIAYLILRANSVKNEPPKK